MLAIVILLAAIFVAYVLWQRRVSRQRLYNRINELEAISDAGRAIVASNLDVEELCVLIATEVGRIIPTRTFQIGLFDDSVYGIVFWRISGVRQEPRSFDLSDNGGIVGYVRDSKEYLLIRDFQIEFDDLPARPRYVSDKPPRSAIFLPLVSGDSVIGVMAAQSPEPNRFAEEDARTLSILANQTAAAIENAQLFKSAQMRAARLELVGRIAQQVNSLTDLDKIFQTVVQQTRTTFGYHPVSICEIDADTGEVILKASTIEELVPDEILVEFGSGIVGAALAEQETVVVNRVADDHRYNSQLSQAEASVIESTKAEIAIPLHAINNIVGVLDVQSEREDTFSDAEVAVLEALAAQVAIAIQMDARVDS